MIKVFILVIGSLITQAEGPAGQSKMFLQQSLEECQTNEKSVNSITTKPGEVQFRAKCIELDFINHGEREAAK